jgi:hypothetical protein
VAWLGSRRYPSVAERPAGDAEPGADPGPGVAAGGQALDGLGYGGVDLISVDLISQARHEDECFHVAVSMGDELLTPIGADPIITSVHSLCCSSRMFTWITELEASASPSPKPTPAGTASQAARTQSAATAPQNRNDSLQIPWATRA